MTNTEHTNPTTPAEIDLALSEASYALAVIDGKLASYRKMMADPRYAHQVRGWEIVVTELETEREPVSATVATLNALYTGWSRFFLVNNSGGHIHKSMECNTCFASTRFSWLPSVSGKTEADAVAEFGEILCSVCFPTAPVAWTTGVAKTVQADRDAKAAAKAEREAKKAAKAIEPVKTAHDTIKTIAAAKGYLTDAYGWHTALTEREGVDTYHVSYTEADMAKVAEALAAKTGEPVADLLAAAEKRAAKRGY